MKSEKESRVSNYKSYLICICLITVVFVVDINLPLGVAGGVPYILVLLIALWTPSQKIILTLALICSVLVVVGYFFSPAGGELWKVLANRALAIFAIWSTAIMTMKWDDERELVLKAKIYAEAEGKRVFLATIHSSQHILNNLLNQLEFIKLEMGGNSTISKDTKRIFGEILTEGKLLMKKLSDVKEFDDKTIKKSVEPMLNQ